MSTRWNGVTVVVAALSAGAAAQELAPARDGFHSPAQRGSSFIDIGERMLAWDTDLLGDDVLAVINTSPPNFAGVTGDIPEIGVGAEIEYGEDGILYVIDTGDNTQLHRLDPNTGAYLGAVTITFPPEGDVITSMEWINGVIYCGLAREGQGQTTDTQLCFVVPDTGQIFLQGATGIAAPWAGIAYPGGAVVYVITAGGSAPELYAVLDNGTATLVGPLMEGASPAPGMTAFEQGPDGQFYALPNINSANAGDLYLVNVETAQVMNLGHTGNPGLVALTNFPACSSADLASPFGELDFDDVLAFLVSFGAGCP